MTALLALLLGIVSLSEPLAGLVPDNRRAVARIVPAVLAMITGAVLSAVLGLVAWQAGIVLLVPLAWRLWEAAAPGPRPELARWAAAIGVLALSAALTGPIVERTAVAAAVTGVLLLLTAPANTAVTSLLAVAGAGQDGTGTPPPQGPPPSPAGRTPSGHPLLLSREVPPPPIGPILHGGRWIGPLERVLLLLLAAGGAHAAVAALVAAKGVIRFPEISKDDTGAKAEEFLIGSLASWTLAVLGALLVSS
ncbi:MAG: beta-carotene 15,15'-monooxygenase [Actinomyces sp.]|uniref:beta-carotene 15,15'-monooxygenase n=1 Tax=Actinomyces sp. TaxID=29317 RepID=UPI0026DB41E2|nr:beta-carotene 15,15'-monooxygenase [Actinomyces sp.]MDO4243447.1 beta-carotene 15,15'-monooxygenase [Actinomyces sp.]